MPATPVLMKETGIFLSSGCYLHIRNYKPNSHNQRMNDQDTVGGGADSGKGRADHNTPG